MLFFGSHEQQLRTQREIIEQLQQSINHLSGLLGDVKDSLSPSPVSLSFPTENAAPPAVPLQSLHSAIGPFCRRSVEVFPFSVHWFSLNSPLRMPLTRPRFPISRVHSMTKCWPGHRHTCITLCLPSFPLSFQTLKGYLITQAVTLDHSGEC